MILLGLGANLRHPDFATLVDTFQAAVEVLAARGIKTTLRSRLFNSAPVPASAQPWFVNGVIRVETDFGPSELLDTLHSVEAVFGRLRREKGEARILDLDLLAFNELQSSLSPILPHPRLHERAFVLLPLADIAPSWCHPTLKKPLCVMVEDLAPGDVATPLELEEYPVNWFSSLL